jgi:hypothetical protein
VTGNSIAGSHGGSGIGTGASWAGNSGVGLVLLSGSLTLVCDLLHAPNVSVSNASIVVFTRAPLLFATPPTVSGALALAVFYGTGSEASQEAWVSDVPYLSIGNMSLPLEGWRFCVSGRGWSLYFFVAVRGLFILVDGEGSYSAGFPVAELGQQHLRGFLKGFFRPRRPFHWIDADAQSGVCGICRSAAFGAGYRIPT